MHAALRLAKSHIGTPDTTVGIIDVHDDLKTIRAKHALDEYLADGSTEMLVEWMTVFAPERFTTLASLKRQGRKVVEWQLAWAVACEADLQLYRKLFISN